ncbi:TetR/AcrR family transcriptional regulator [Salinadaptatus halalkaliphilus]|uniref:TetR/AcrR family transcriptional regulator n=1 Tax=Salinadaptatus halalkaliphilus TaxID=2419781 RepID=A0A4S3TMC7_9EURY|nr:TetR/AcrR family transcriptional regulator [Salinadaptatus halalkaliphilus]THE65276.1 TetR/AcrR family transcriptional regulator [Salinadaptatus halalkaliphilus]
MKGFSDEERERIRASLLECGRELFAQYGLERTRIKDITDDVGIGTSTFYQFFDSKEELYVDVLIAERKRLNAELEAAVEDIDSPREQVRVTLETVFEAIESNPLISRLVVEGELRLLQNQLSDAERRAIIEEFGNERLGYIDGWVDNPAFKYDDPRIVDGLLRLLAFVTRSKDIDSETNGVSEYEVIRGALIDVVVDGLFEDNGESQ